MYTSQTKARVSRFDGTAAIVVSLLLVGLAVAALAYVGIEAAAALSDFRENLDTVQ